MTTRLHVFLPAGAVWPAKTILTWNSCLLPQCMASSLPHLPTPHSCSSRSAHHAWTHGHIYTYVHTPPEPCSSPAPTRSLRFPHFPADQKSADTFTLVSSGQYSHQLKSLLSRNTGLSPIAARRTQAPRPARSSAQRGLWRLPPFRAWQTPTL